MTIFAALGECMLEFHETNGNQYHLGYAGDTYNTTVYIARYQAQHKITPYYITAIGTDYFSQQMRSHFQQENICLDFIDYHPTKLPGLYIIRTDEYGERSFYYYREQSAAREMLSSQHLTKLIQASKNIGYFYFSAISLAILSTEKRTLLIELLKNIRQNNGQVIFDGNYRPRLWASPSLAQTVISSILPFVTTALPTFNDEAQLFGDSSPAMTIARLRQLGIEKVIVKNGGAPSHYQTSTEAGIITPSQCDKIIDTTGAGDAFNAGFLISQMVGHTLTTSIKFAHLLAGLVISYPGAILLPDQMPNFQL